MAISEETKRAVQQKRQSLEQNIKRNLKDIEVYETGIARLKASNATITKEFDALKKDIPTPTPPKPEAI